MLRTRSPFFQKKNIKKTVNKTNFIFESGFSSGRRGKRRQTALPQFINPGGAPVLTTITCVPAMQELVRDIEIVQESHHLALQPLEPMVHQ